MQRSLPATVLPLLAVALLVGACGAGEAASAAGPTPTPTAARATEAASDGATLSDQRSEGGGVEIVATWAASDPPSLKVTMDTHSIDLDGFDLARLAKLRLDGGDWVTPTAFDAPKGGHHRTGKLTFGTVTPAAFWSARVIELRIADVAVPERLLRWERAK